MTECPAAKYDLKNNFYIKDELVEITCFVKTIIISRFTFAALHRMWSLSQRKQNA